MHAALLNFILVAISVMHLEYYKTLYLTGNTQHGLS